MLTSLYVGGLRCTSYHPLHVVTMETRKAVAMDTKRIVTILTKMIVPGNGLCNAHSHVHVHGLFFMYVWGAPITNGDTETRSLQSHVCTCMLDACTVRCPMFR